MNIPTSPVPPADGQVYTFDNMARMMVPKNSGDVFGPSWAVNNDLASFDGPSGKHIKDSGMTLAELMARDIAPESANNGKWLKTVAGAFAWTAPTPGDIGAIAKGELGIDVRDYGVTGNGTSDDTSGIQGAIDDAATVGDSVLFPPGLYMVSGLTHGVTNPIALIGRGGLGTWNGPTTIKRIFGTAPVLSCLGTGAGGNQRSRVTIQDLTLDGNGGGGSVLRLYRCNDVQLHRVRVRNTTGSAIWASELWNAAFSHLYVTDSGDGTTSPAVLFDDAGGAVGNSITVTMTNCEWEGNTGVELRLTSALYGCDQIHLINGKFDRGAGLGGYPFCDLSYAGDSKLIGVHFVSTDSATNPVFITQMGAASAYGPNIVMGCSFDSWAPAPTYFVDQTVGKLVAVGNAMKATAAAPTAFWHIGSAVAADGVTESSNYTNYPTVFQDDR